MAAKYPDISDWSVQLAKNYEPSKLPYGTEFSITLKVNGARCTYFDEELVSRGGKYFLGLGHIKQELRWLEETYHTEFPVLDGELVLKDEWRKGLTENEAFKKAVGIANATKDMSEKYKLKFIVFDAIPEYEFVEEKSRTIYEYRKNLLNKVFGYNTFDPRITSIEPIPTFYTGKDRNQIQVWYDTVTLDGQEGIIINTLNGKYNFAGTTNYRTWDLMKLKAYDTLDLRITGFEEEKTIEGIPKNTLGKLVCILPDRNDFKEIRVSGINNELKQTIWNNPGSYFGKTIEVKFNSITSDKVTGMKSVQSPRFICFREDK